MAYLQFFQQFDGAVIGFRCRLAAFLASLFDSALFVSVEPLVMIVKLDPLIPLHRSQPHGYIVRAMFERSVRKRLRLMYIPIRVRRCCRSLEVDWYPYAGLPFWSFVYAARSYRWLFRIRCICAPGLGLLESCNISCYQPEEARNEQDSVEDDLWVLHEELLATRICCCKRVDRTWSHSC